MTHIYEIASNLYDGGWTSSDYDQIKSEYELTDEEADEICKALDALEYHK